MSVSPGARIAIEPARQPEVERLLAISDAYAAALYPPESCYQLDVSELEAPEVTVFVARVEGEALGMAALMTKPHTHPELKRLVVDDRARGQGLAGRLLAAIEEHARDAGARAIQLETGPLSTAALALYGKHGYVHIPNFEPYVGDDFSVCLEKAL
jgi:putative acetyltransferase